MLDFWFHWKSRSKELASQHELSITGLCNQIALFYVSNHWTQMAWTFIILFRCCGFRAKLRELINLQFEWGLGHSNQPMWLLVRREIVNRVLSCPDIFCLIKLLFVVVAVDAQCGLAASTWTSALVVSSQDSPECFSCIAHPPYTPECFSCIAHPPYTVAILASWLFDM